MLRDILIGTVAGLLILALMGWVVGGIPLLGPTAFLAVVLAGLVYENRRHKKQ